MPRFTRLEMIGKYAIMLIAIVVVQGIFAHKFPFFRYFDLPLICTIYYGFAMGDPITSIIMGSSLGLMQDSLSAAALGTNAFSKTLIGFLAASACSIFAVDQLITRIVAIFFFSLGDGLVVTMIALMVSPAANASLSRSVGQWMFSAGLNTLAGLILLMYRDRLTNAAT
jgi:rod shape-determining protein MreD